MVADILIGLDASAFGLGFGALLGRWWGMAERSVLGIRCCEWVRLRGSVRRMLKYGGRRRLVRNWWGREGQGGRGRGG